MRGQLPPGFSAAFSQRVRTVREARGLSINVLAKRAGLDWRQIARLESGETNTDLHVSSLANLARCLSVPMGYLLDGDAAEIPQRAEDDPVALKLDELPAEIGARLRQLRERQGFTLAELARRSTINSAQIWRIEDGRPFGIRLSTIRSLAAALSVTVGDLIGEDKPRAQVLSEGDLLGALEGAIAALERADIARDGSLGLLWLLGRLERATGRLVPAMLKR